jgi:hypothetical protein
MSSTNARLVVDGFWNVFFDDITYFTESIIRVNERITSDTETCAGRAFT